MRTNFFDDNTPNIFITKITNIILIIFVMKISLIKFIFSFKIIFTVQFFFIKFFFVGQNIFDITFSIFMMHKIKLEHA